MDISRFVNRDIGVALQALPPLTHWEQYHIILSSTRPLREKKTAYEALLSELPQGHKLVEHVKRNIARIDEALSLSCCDPMPGHIFIAHSMIEIVDEYGITKGRGRNNKKYFSTYRNAKLWLDGERSEALKDSGFIEPFQTIDQSALDTHEYLVSWYFDACGEIWKIDSVEREDSLPSYDEDDPSKLEERLASVAFSPGDILFWRHLFWSSSRMYANGGLLVMPFGEQTDGKRSIVNPKEEELLVSGMCHTMKDFPGNGAVWKEEFPLFALERFHGVLPEAQKKLLDISRHFKGEKLLDEDEIRRLDPDGVFTWYQ